MAYQDSLGMQKMSLLGTLTIKKTFLHTFPSTFK
jgi:hypothetical protein